jgi:hypothetical protein
MLLDYEELLRIIGISPLRSPSSPYFIYSPKRQSQCQILCLIDQISKTDFSDIVEINYVDL